MRTRFARLSAMLLALSLAAALPLLQARADNDDDEDKEPDHETALEARQRGDVLPLEAVLAAVRQRAPGEVVDVELERDDGRWVYKIALIDSSGEVLEVLADAKTAAIIKVEGD